MSPTVPPRRWPTRRTWPATGLSDALKDTARLIKADVGTEVVSIDYGSWDMHADYGGTTSGNMQNMVGGFARSVDAFLRDLGPLRSRVTLVTISEFGRRVAENGNRGLDHGWGNMMLLMGAGVQGGRYYASWPGLGAGAAGGRRPGRHHRLPQRARRGGRQPLPRPLRDLGLPRSDLPAGGPHGGLRADRIEGADSESGRSC